MWKKLQSCVLLLLAKSSGLFTLMYVVCYCHAENTALQYTMPSLPQWNTTTTQLSQFKRFQVYMFTSRYKVLQFSVNRGMKPSGMLSERENCQAKKPEGEVEEVEQRMLSGKWKKQYNTRHHQRDTWSNYW